MSGIKLEVSDKVSIVSKRPLVKKGYYPAKLLEIKPRQKDDGTPIEGKFGRQIILMFQVFKEDMKTPMTYVDKVEGMADKNMDLIMPLVLNSEYKNKDGSYSTAVTPKSRITQVFQALGWKFDAKNSLDVDSFIGKWVEVNIDDYSASTKDKDGVVTATYPASAIKDVKVWNPENGSEEEVVTEENKKSLEESKPKVVNKTLTSPEIEEQMKQLNDLKAKNLLSESGYNIAVEQLKAKQEK